MLSRNKENVFERAFRSGLRSRLSLAVGVPVAPQDVTPEDLKQRVAACAGTGNNAGNNVAFTKSAMS
jgi:hypothetical protein